MGFRRLCLLQRRHRPQCRSETNSAFNRDILSDRHQLLLYGLALLLTFLPTELGFIQRSLGLTSLSVDQWLLCIVLAIALLLVDEVVKIFPAAQSQPLRSPHRQPAICCRLPMSKERVRSITAG